MGLWNASRSRREPVDQSTAWRLAGISASTNNQYRRRCYNKIKNIDAAESIVDTLGSLVAAYNWISPTVVLASPPSPIPKALAAPPSNPATTLRLRRRVNTNKQW